MGGVVPGEAPPPDSAPLEVMPGMEVPAIARHAGMMTILCMSILLFAFGSGMSRSKWHHWAGGVAVGYGLLAACFTPRHGDHVGKISTFVGSEMHRWMGSIIITLIFSQGVTGVFMFLSREKAEKESPTGWRGIRGETRGETRAASADGRAAGVTQSALGRLKAIVANAVYPFRLFIAALHGWCGLWLPL